MKSVPSTDNESHAFSAFSPCHCLQVLLVDPLDLIPDRYVLLPSSLKHTGLAQSIRAKYRMYLCLFAIFFFFCTWSYIDSRYRAVLALPASVASCHKVICQRLRAKRDVKPRALLSAVSQLRSAMRTGRINDRFNPFVRLVLFGMFS